MLNWDKIGRIIMGISSNGLNIAVASLSIHLSILHFLILTLSPKHSQKQKPLSFSLVTATSSSSWRRFLQFSSSKVLVRITLWGKILTSFLFVLSCHKCRDSSLSMAKSTYFCQKFVYGLKSHVQILKQILIGQNYSIYVFKWFNRFKTFLCWF